MKNIRYICSGIILLIISFSAVAQDDQKLDSTTGMQASGTRGPDNVFKLNLSSLALKNISLQYERKLGRKFSVCLGFRLMPQSPLPFYPLILTRIQSQGSDSSGQNAIRNARIGNWALTPEIRFYTGKKGAPRGFYIALFARYAQFNMDVPITFTSQNGQPYNLQLNGKLNGIGGGFLLGYQWLIGRHVTLDWWIFGPMFGVSKSSLDAIADLSGLSAQDKQQLVNNIQTFGIPLTTINASVSNSGVQVNANSVFPGIRGLGLNLGIAF
ncbi:MAG TPA: DUF3575 domain-containing protein [Chitinophagaceae bacterium]|nr:DUF3575 domain-containing protein [Chitinophagaceae bacterium]